MVNDVDCRDHLLGSGCWLASPQVSRKPWMGAARHEQPESMAARHAMRARIETDGQSLVFVRG
jgi:hypothetical protein